MEGFLPPPTKDVLTGGGRNELFLTVFAREGLQTSPWEGADLAMIRFSFRKVLNNPSPNLALKVRIN